MSGRRVNLECCSAQLRVDYAHVGVFDVAGRQIWVACQQPAGGALRVAHARLLTGGGQDVSVVEKDHFVCYWFYTPGSGQGYVHGYPIEWQEGHVMVRLEPQWDYLAQQYVPAVDSARIERNTEQQYAWGQALFNAYVALRPAFALSWHMIGPRPTDSMFYVQRVEGGGGG